MNNTAHKWIHLPIYEVRETNITHEWFLVYYAKYWHIHAAKRTSLRTAGHTT